jgi:hypothetical protein
MELPYEDNKMEVFDGTLNHFIRTPYKYLQVPWPRREMTQFTCAARNGADIHKPR